MNAQIGQIQQGLQVQRAQWAWQQMMYQKMNAGSLTSTYGLPKEVMELRVPVPTTVKNADGSTQVINTFQRAATPALAKDVQDFQNKASPAIQGLNQVLIASQNSSSLSPEDRAKTAAILGTQVIPGLKASLSATGRFNDKEIDRLTDLIGDPDKIFALKGVEQAKLRTVLSGLQQDLSTKYNNAGIQYVNPNEQNIAAVQKKYPNMNRDQTMNALMAAKKWDPRY